MASNFGMPTMKAHRLLPCWALLAFPLTAQTSQRDEINRTPELSVLKLKQTMDSVTNYCDAVDEFSHAHQARLFAESRSEPAGRTEWVELVSKEEWERAGRPRPLAFAWYRGDRVVRVTISVNSAPAASVAYADYCYSPEGKLVRLHSGPSTKVVCDAARFQCHLAFGVFSFFSSKGRLIAKVLIGSDPTALKPERTSFGWVQMMPPLYLRIWDLPFDPESRRLAKTDPPTFRFSRGKS